MQPKTLIWFGVAVGSTIGGLVPTLWGAGVLSLSSVVGSVIGGVLGVWAGVRAAESLY